MSKNYDWSTSYYVNTQCSLEDFLANLTLTKTNLESLGFDVSIDQGSTQDEVWDGPNTHFYLFLKMSISPEKMQEVKILSKNKWEIERKNCIDRYHLQQGDWLNSSEKTQQSKIDTLEKAYQYVLIKKNHNHEDVGVVSALRGLDKAKLVLNDIHEKQKQYKNNPLSDEEILGNSSLNNFDSWFESNREHLLTNHLLSSLKNK